MLPIEIPNEINILFILTLQLCITSIWQDRFLVIKTQSQKQSVKYTDNMIKQTQS